MLNVALIGTRSRVTILMTHYVMLQRNLVYTGVTRAKKGLILAGTKKPFLLPSKT